MIVEVIKTNFRLFYFFLRENLQAQKAQKAQKRIQANKNKKDSTFMRIKSV